MDRNVKESVDAIITIDNLDGEEVSFSTEEDRGDVYIVMNRKELLEILQNMDE